MLNSTLFSCFASIIYIASLLIVGKLAPTYLKPNLPAGFERRNGFSYTRYREAESTTQKDVLFLGSSHAYRGYDPRIFEKAGFSSFNLGSSSQTPVQTLFLLRKYIDRFQPKLVVLDIYPVLLNSDGVESTLDLMTNAPIDFSWMRLALTVNDIRVYNTFVFSLFKKLLSEEIQEQSRYDGVDTYVEGGYVETFKVITLPYNSLKANKYQLNENQYEALLGIKRELTVRSIPFRIFQAPVLPGRYAKATNVEHIDSLMAGLDTNYINFNKHVLWSDSLFADDSHLNQYGVDVYNKQILQLLPAHNAIDNIISKK